MIFRRRIRVVLAVLCACVWPTGCLISQVIAKPEPFRTLNIRAVAGQPSFTLRISVSGRQGLVEVRNGADAVVQTLTCLLLRGEADPSEPAFKAVAEEFVSRFETEDLDLDGYLDLKGMREFGAKWGRYCVWLFDPNIHRFEQDELAEQMELLTNLAADPKSGRIISYSIGPVNPWVDVYRIERAGRDRPYSRLIPVQSCFIETTSSRGLEALPADDTVVLTRYEHGHAVAVRRPVRSRLCGELLGRRW